MRSVGVGRRFVALLVDGLLVGIVVAPFRPFDVVRSPGYYRFHVGAGGLFGPGLVWIAYFFVMEGLVGATLGKFVMGIRVVKEDGSRLDWSAALIRNVARIVDAFPYFLPYLVGAISVWSSDPLRQRLGDRWASTVVVTGASLSAYRSVPRVPGERMTASHGEPSDGSPPLPPPPPPRP